MYYLNKFFQKFGYYIGRTPQQILLSNKISYEVANSSSILYQQFFANYDLAEGSLKQRLHLFDKHNKRSNHDPIVMDLFVKLLTGLNKDTTNICELGVWRGGVDRKPGNYWSFD